MMKRLIIAILCMAVLSLAACGNESTSSTTESQSVSDVSGTTQNIQGTEPSENNTSENHTETGEGAGDGTEVTAEKATEEMMITITAGDHVITAVLYDNAAGRALWDKLPLTLPMMNLYDREMCYRFGAGGLPEDDAEDTGYEIGDISYWPPAGSLVILYKQNGEVFEQQPIGHTDDDISFFDGMPDMDIVFEKVENEVDNAADNEDEEADDNSMTLKIGETEVPVTWENNASVEELKGLLPLSIQMSMYGGFEQVGSIGLSISRDDSQITTEPGDIVLYSGNQIVIFYGSNSWAYTRLGHVELGEDEMKELLGNGNVTVTITIK